MKYVMSFILIFISLTAYSQSNSYFKFFNNGNLKFEYVGKLFEKNDSLMLFSTAKLLIQDNNSVIRVQSSTIQNSDFIKIFQGNVTSNITYSIYDAFPYFDKNYLIGSYRTGGGLESYNFFCSKFENNNLSKTKIIGEPNIFESARSVDIDDDNNLIICGLSRKPNTTNVNEPLIVKLDTNLNILWQRKISTDLGHLEANAVATDIENNIYIFAEQHSLGSMGQAVLIKLNNKGDSLWSKAYPGSSSIPKDLCFNKNGNLIGSITGDYDGNGRTFTFMELDTSGKVLWTRSYLEEIGDAVFAEKFVELINGGYAVALNNGYPVLLVVDENGEPTNIQYFDGYGVKDIQDIIELSDGSFAMAGNYHNIDPTDLNTMWLIKTNEKGELITHTIESEFPNARIFPNPTNGIVNIENLQYDLLHIVSINGGYIGSYLQNERIDLSNCSKGMYIIIIESNGKQYTSKIVKE